jgi:hypothetical protein
MYCQLSCCIIFTQFVITCYNLNHTKSYYIILCVLRGTTQEMRGCEKVYMCDSMRAEPWVKHILSLAVTLAPTRSQIHHTICPIILSLLLVLVLSIYPILLSLSLLFLFILLFHFCFLFLLILALHYPLHLHSPSPLHLPSSSLPTHLKNLGIRFLFLPEHIPV